jgi:tyrosine-protein phosphatase YwqE
MRIFSESDFKIYVYDDEHPPPHCHVIFNNGTELCITLPLLTEMFGKTIKKSVRKFLEKNIEVLVEEWEKRNPKNHNL